MMRRLRKSERGFTFLELAIAMLIVIILVAVVVLLVTGFFGEARERGYDADQRIVQNAVNAFATESMKWPTENGKLPTLDEYAEIDFHASFNRNGQTVSFYPHFLSELPRHADEGVWLIDSASRVSVDMEPEEY